MGPYASTMAGWMDTSIIKPFGVYSTLVLIVGECVCMCMRARLCQNTIYALNINMNGEAGR